MYLLMAMGFLYKGIGLLLSTTIGAGSGFPELLYIASGIWMIVAVLFLAYERGTHCHVSQLVYFYAFDFVYTVFALVYTGWIHVFDVAWYHYPIIGTIFTLVVDLVIILIAIRHTSYRKYIEIPKEMLKNVEQQDETH